MNRRALLSSIAVGLSGCLSRSRAGQATTTTREVRSGGVPSDAETHPQAEWVDLGPLLFQIAAIPLETVKWYNGNTDTLEEIEPPEGEQFVTLGVNFDNRTDEKHRVPQPDEFKLTTKEGSREVDHLEELPNGAPLAEAEVKYYRVVDEFEQNTLAPDEKTWYGVLFLAKKVNWTDYVAVWRPPEGQPIFFVD